MGSYRAYLLGTVVALALAFWPAATSHDLSGTTRAPASDALAALGVVTGTKSAQSDQAKKAQETKDVVDASKAISKDLGCGKALIDDLNANIHGYHCVTYYDHSCSTIYTAASGAVMGGVGIKNYVADHTAERAERRYLKNKAYYESEAEMGQVSEANNAEFKKAKDAVKKYDLIEGKYLTDKEVRLQALKNLEQMSSDPAQKLLVQRMASATRTEVLAMATKNAARGLGLVTGTLAVGFAASTMADFMIGTTGGSACEGHPYVDYVPESQGGKGCEVSFSVTGEKFRRFMNESPDTQIEVLGRDPLTCSYMTLMNQQLKGTIVDAAKTLNKARFAELPVCGENGKGVKYNISLPGAPFQVDSSEKIDTFQVTADYFDDGINIRSLGVQNVVKDKINSDMKFFFEGNIAKYVEVQRASSYSPTFRAQLEDVEKAAKQGQVNAFQKVQVLANSTYYTRQIMSCCEKGAADRSKCFKDTLPGLKDQAVKAAESSQTLPETKTLSTKPGEQ